jgi:phosphoribosylglycinamide formyltransferase-1
MSRKTKVGVLISGRGSNLQALLDAAKAPDYPAEIALVLSNKADAYGLERARQCNVATDVISQKDYGDRESFDAALTERFKAANVQLVCLAGFMRILSDQFVNTWRDRVLNIHPSLLPSFKGLHVHERVVAAGVKLTGCTVHYVRTEMDSGPIVAQAAVPVAGVDDTDNVAARVLAMEHQLYPLALGLVASGRVRVTGEKVIMDPPPNDMTGNLIFPTGYRD